MGRDTLERGGWGVHSPALGRMFPSLLCFSYPQTSNCSGPPPTLEHNWLSTVDNQLPGRQGHAPHGSEGTDQAGDQSCPLTANRQMTGARQAERRAGVQQHRPLFSAPGPQGRETSANQDTSPKRGGRDVLEPALAALAAGSGAVLPHPRALGHNDQVSRHQVCSPTLPCLPAHGKSLSPGRKAIPDAACVLVPHQSSHPATRRWLEPGPACTNTDPLPPPTHVHTHTQSVPR